MALHPGYGVLSTVGAFRQLQAELASGTICSECFDEAALALCHKYGLAVAAPKGKIGWFLCVQAYFTLDFSVRRQDRNCALQDPGHENPARDIHAQSIDTEVAEFRDEAWRYEL